jgi:flavin reductase (DIM6/NTAB) family NADH-FMN oxidoreductase RutF
MRDLSIEKALVLMPLPLVIVTTESRDGKKAGMTAAWVTQVSWKPPYVAVAIYNKWFTLKVILERGELALNYVSPSLASVALKVFGLLSSARVDKFEIAEKNYNTRIGYGKSVRVPVLLDAPVIIECKLFKYFEIGDHYLVICDPILAYKGSDEEPISFYKGKLHTLSEYRTK